MNVITVNGKTAIGPEADEIILIFALGVAWLTDRNILPYVSALNALAKESVDDMEGKNPLDPTLSNAITALLDKYE